MSTGGDRIAVSVPLNVSPAKEQGSSRPVFSSPRWRECGGGGYKGGFRKVRGFEGRSVELTVLRDEEERRFSVERVRVDTRAVAWNHAPDGRSPTPVGEVKNSASEFEKAITCPSYQRLLNFLVFNEGYIGHNIKL